MKKYSIEFIAFSLLLVLIWGVSAMVSPDVNKLVDTEKSLSDKVISYSDFIKNIKEGKFKDVILTEKTVNVVQQDSVISASVLNDPTLANRLSDMGANVVIKHVDDGKQGNSVIASIIINMLPTIVFIAFVLLILQKSAKKMGGPLSFARSKAKLSKPEEQKVTFKDVAGVDEARDELKEIVEFLKNPSKFTKLGGKIPRGILLVGPPGTGKTLLAKAVAGEANVPFFSVSGSDFVEMFVGVGAGRVRSLFEEGRKNSPCIIFIDEIDAMGRHRGAGTGGGNDEREQTLNQMLVEMDGFEPNAGVILIAATNRPDVLDSALTRPGRFDRQIMVPNPDLAGRKRILEVHSTNVPLSPDVDLNILARGTPGFSGADLKNIINEAALRAASLDKDFVTSSDLESAKDKILMGSERRSLKLTKEEIELTAYHEAGHALVACSMKECDPVHKATVMPRGRALGMVVSLPEADRSTMTLRKAEAYLVMSLAGRAAEIEVFGADNVTSGASSDIKFVTGLARRMVTEWGFSDKLGPISYSEDNDMNYIMSKQNTSEETSNTIDAEIRRLISDASDKARDLIKSKRIQLNAIANALIENETLSGDEVRALAGV